MRKEFANAVEFTVGLHNLSLNTTHAGALAAQQFLAEMAANSFKEASIHYLDEVERVNKLLSEQRAITQRAGDITQKLEERLARIARIRSESQPTGAGDPTVNPNPIPAGPENPALAGPGNPPLTCPASATVPGAMLDP